MRLLKDQQNGNGRRHSQKNGLTSLPRAIKVQIQESMLKEEAKEEIVSESHSKKLKPSQDHEGTEDSEVSWQVLKGRMIVSGETLAEMLHKEVCYRVCQAVVTLLENVNCRSGLGSTWIINYSNEQCPLKESNRSFNTTDRRKGFEINRAAVLDLTEQPLSDLELVPQPAMSFLRDRRGVFASSSPVAFLFPLPLTSAAASIPGCFPFLVFPVFSVALLLAL